MIKPTIVLTLITTLISALLIISHDLTYVDTSGIITEKLAAACTEIMGDGEYALDTESALPEGVSKIILKDGETAAFEIITSGYNKNGLDLLIAMNSDGSIKGISVVSITETPGLGTNVNDQTFLSRFSGLSDEVTIVKKTPSAETEVEAVSGATYSSKGTAKAVNIAINAWNALKS